MAGLPLVFACGAESFEPLWDGTVALDGIDLTFVRHHAIPERHRRMIEEQEFDVCEYSMGNYLTGFPLGQPFTAVPVFPSRRFRQSYVWVSRAAAIEAPQQLAGKRLGIAMWSNSALLWHRAFLQHDYGVDLASPEWVSDRPDVPGYQPPAWARIHNAPPGASLEGLVAGGEVDAILLPTPPRFAPGEEAQVQRLFPDYVSVEQDYFQRTGLFPPMHTVVVKNSVLAEHPWVAESVYAGLARMLDVYVERQRAANAPSPIWPELTWREQEAVLGPQPWPCGLAANRATLQAAVSYAVEQGLIARPMEPEALFQLEGRALAGCAT
jgi:4,5-dihydroxyphthalate decarboxylase